MRKRSGMRLRGGSGGGRVRRLRGNVLVLVMGYGRGRAGMLEWMFDDCPVRHTRCLERPFIDDGQWRGATSAISIFICTCLDPTISAQKSGYARFLPKSDRFSQNFLTNTNLYYFRWFWIEL